VVVKIREIREIRGRKKEEKFVQFVKFVKFVVEKKNFVVEKEMEGRGMGKKWPEINQK